DQLRPQLEQQVRTNAAIAQVFDAVKKYEAAHDSGAGLIDSAKAAGVTPQPLGPISATGKDLNGQPVQGLDPKLLKIAFTLPQGGESELIDVGQGNYFAVRVEKIAPPALPTLAEIRPQLTRLYLAQALVDALSAKADQVAEAIRKGQTVPAAAAANHAQGGRLPNVTRQQLQQSRQLGPDMIDKLFSAKQGDVVSGQIGQVAFMVARIDVVRPADAGDAARMAAEASKSFNDVLAGDMVEAAEKAAVAKVRPTGSIAAARAALGLSPEQAQSGAPQSGTPAKRGPAL